MKALTIRQPWAGSIFELGKDVENRSWTTVYRGPLLIHAGSAMWGSNRRIKELKKDEPAWQAGAILGVVELVDVVRNYPSAWAMAGQCWHWVLEDPQLFENPVSMNGAMGLWDVELTDELLDLL